MKTGIFQTQEVNSSASQSEKYFQEVLTTRIPATGLLCTGLVFLPGYSYEAVLCMEVLIKFIRQEGLELIEYHELKIRQPGDSFFPEPGKYNIAQVFIKSDLDQLEFEQKLLQVCEQAEQQIHHSKLKHRQSFSIGSLSTQILQQAS